MQFIMSKNEVHDKSTLAEFELAYHARAAERAVQYRDKGSLQWARVLAADARESLKAYKKIIARRV